MFPIPPPQKPLALWERIIAASCPEHGIVLDPFAGCATACTEAEQIGRQWVGIDISPKAAELVERRMRDELGMFHDGAHRSVRTWASSRPAARTRRRHTASVCVAFGHNDDDHLGWQVYSARKAPADCPGRAWV